MCFSPTESGREGGEGNGKPQSLLPAVKSEEDEDSDKDALVVDENPQPRQASKRNSAAKPGSLRLKLSSKNHHLYPLAVFVWLA